MDLLYNPWSVKNIEEFLYYCCPECEVKDQSKESFLKHALDQHPNSKDSIFSLEFKNEFHENDENDGYFHENVKVKCEITEEDKQLDVLKNNQNNISKLDYLEHFVDNACLDCSKEFSSPWHLKRHFESVHKGSGS